MQLTNEQRTYLQNILDAKDIEKEHAKLLERIAKEIKKELQSIGPRPPHPH